MNCTDARNHLPGLLYGDLAPSEKAAVEQHLSGCPACRNDLASLGQLRELLDRVPAPAVTVDVGRLYQQLAERHSIRARRWRRAALALTAAAAAVLLVAFGLRLEIRAEGHQLVLRWGTPPPERGTPPERPDPPALVQTDRPPDDSLASQLELQTKLIHALAGELERRDRQRGGEIEVLRERLRQVQLRSDLQWTMTKRHVDALDTAVFVPPKKGAVP